jgi:hypothetical protein
MTGLSAARPPALTGAAQIREHHVAAHNPIADLTRLAGRWVTEARYAETYSISRQSLANWRYRDRQAGRTEAGPGFPVYRRFGKAVRYLLEAP